MTGFLDVKIGQTRTGGIISWDLLAGKFDSLCARVSVGCLQQNPLLLSAAAAALVLASNAFTTQFRQQGASIMLIMQSLAGLACTYISMHAHSKPDEQFAHSALS